MKIYQSYCQLINFLDISDLTQVTEDSVVKILIYLTESHFACGTSWNNVDVKVWRQKLYIVFGSWSSKQGAPV